MPKHSEHLPPTPQSLWQAIRDLRRDMQQLRASRRLESAAIGTGGLVITGDGYLKVLDTDGSILFQIGLISPHPDGSPQRGVLISREDGTAALSVAAVTSHPGDPQGIVVRDARGTVLLAEDVTAGGLARPWLNIPMYPARSADLRQSTSGTYETVWRGVTDIHNPRLTVSGWSVTAGGTTGNVQVLVNGALFGAPVAVSTSLTQFTVGPLTHGLPIGSDVTVEIQAQMTSGAGPVSVGVDHVRGEQS